MFLCFVLFLVCILIEEVLIIKTFKICILHNCKLLFNLFKGIGGHFDPLKLKKLYVDRVSIINTSNYANGSTNLLGKIKFISIAFEDFKKSLKELEQKSGCGLVLIDFV